MGKTIVRIVRMTFKPEMVEAFVELFDERSDQIRAFPGCEQLDLVRSASVENVFATISVWSSVEALEAYRSSQLFRETWTVTKEMFAGRPEAETFEPFRSVKPPV